MFFFLNQTDACCLLACRRKLFCGLSGNISEFPVIQRDACRTVILSTSSVFASVPST